MHPTWPTSPFKHDRDLVRVPLPHVALQSPHELQLLNAGQSCKSKQSILRKANCCMLGDVYLGITRPLSLKQLRSFRWLVTNERLSWFWIYNTVSLEISSAIYGAHPIKGYQVILCVVPQVNHIARNIASHSTWTYISTNCFHSAYILRHRHWWGH